MKIILVMGLPGAGKTTLANELAKLIKAKRLNADEIRKAANDWDFSEEGRTRQAKRMLEIANNCGYLSDLPPLIKEKDINKVAKKDILIICTGSQGEPRGALNRIANGDHQKISLNKGDKVIFSSRVIPGNEKYISRLQNKISDQTVHYICLDY